MQEKNKHILQEAIQKLPQYEPETLVWLAIDAELDVLQNENKLQNAIEELPVYNPADSLWENIDAELESDLKKAGRVVWMRRIASAAAVIAFLFVGNYMFNQNNGEESVTISYSQEVVEADLLVQDWDDDDDAFEVVMNFCKNQNIVCELPEFVGLKSELEELNEAREELKEALDHYGSDAELIAQLTRIEHDRSDVLKQMIEKI